MQQRLLRLAFWGATAFAFVMAILPKPPELPGAPSDKVQHIAAFLTLATLAALAFPGRSLLRIALALSAFGALIEVVQAIPALHRDSDVVDWIADTAAVAVILLLASAVRRRRAQSG